MGAYLLTNQGIVAEDTVLYPYQERGLQFGDGIYEVIRVYQGEPYLISLHLDRLYRSAEAIKLRMPIEREQLHKQLLVLLEQNEVDHDGSIYLQVTRGSAKRLHLFPDCEPNFYAYTDALPRPLANLKNGVKAITHKDIRWHYCYIKSLNLLPNVLAKQAAAEQGAFDAIFHRDGTVTESTAANVYIIKDHVIYTHPATERILHGCVRTQLLNLARTDGLVIEERAFTLEEMLTADEVFLTSSGIEVLPVVQIDGDQIGSGVPGLVTRRLQHLYDLDAGL
ncbi:D-alanine aminotransferase apoenzyme [Amphibacillus marinus]|uniref:D-alanine aminotransferase n=1 Tax=Amphibacillus marinus TaxID=872970 RepID=A0A1H8MUZ0_9BACI|nr:D-amino-acid transaminase [Amphibacillus marinus]SEO21070.1 D-alanine aminotransferase apoenzyme [Amphibacillus marinus]